MYFGFAWLAVWLAALVSKARLGWLFPFIGLALLVAFGGEPPSLRLLASTLGFLYLMKAAVLGRFPELALPPIDRLAYFSIWPGMDPDRLVKRDGASIGTGKRFARGLSFALVGLGVALVVGAQVPRLSAAAVGWLGIATLLVTVHFGLSEILTALFQLAGRPVAPLFDRPLSSASLSDFWTRRWNRPFVDMNRRLFMPTLVRKLGIRGAVFATFLISGLLHEMAISYPAGGGWGLPTLYFAIQGAGVLLERRFKASRVVAWVIILGPLPLLFHHPFREALVEPLFTWLHTLLVQQSPPDYMSALLWALGFMQFAVLLASGQVPKRLNWSEELARLSPFNRKLMWTYGAFIVATIVAFATLTLAMHNSFLRGDRAAVGLATFMSLFWCLRLLFDTFYFKSEDWPEGESLKVGHALLNALFLFLAGGYGAVALWGAFGPWR